LHPLIRVIHSSDFLHFKTPKMAPRPFFVPTVLALLLPLLWLLLIDVRPVFPLNFSFFLVGTNQFERHTFEFLAQEFARRGHKVVTVKPILIPEEPRLVCDAKE
jgi:hypothetical protein